MAKKLRIGHWIRGWRLDKFFTRLFNGISEEAQKLIPVVIAITNGVKEVINSPIPDIATKLIPGTWDDKLLEKVREKLPQLIIALDIANVTANIEDPLQRANAVLALFKFSSDEEKNDFYHKISYRLLEYMSDGNLSRREAIHLAQMYYDYKYKEAA